MALGAPLVTTHMGGIADMVTDGESALVVPPGDVAATAAALARISRRPGTAASGCAAQASVEVRRYLQSAVAAQTRGDLLVAGVTSRRLRGRAGRGPG